MKQKPFIMPPYNKLLFTVSDNKKSTKDLLDSLGAATEDSYEEHVSIGDIIYNIVSQNGLSEKALESAISEIKDERDRLEKEQEKELSNQVLVPKHIADWYDRISWLDLKGKLSQLYATENKQVQDWVESESETQEIVAKMHLFGFDVAPDDEFVWRKKPEHIAHFENPQEQYLSHNRYVDGYYLGALSPSATLASEERAKEILGDSFDMFEKEKIPGPSTLFGHGKKFDPGALA